MGVYTSNFIIIAKIQKQKNMKKLIIIVCASTLLISCGAINRTISGNTIDDLKKQVSVETGCAVEKIVLIDKIQNLGNATYSLDVCGKRMVYKQIGSVFMKAEEVDKLLKRGN